ncbi:MAG: YfiR family protein [Vulcanimicrobiota bacterium]
MKNLSRCLLLFALFALPALAQTREDQLKTAFVYQFIRYVEWPQPLTTARLAVVGEGEFADALMSLEGRDADGVRIEVRPVADISELGGYDVIFVSRSHATLIPSILEQLRGKPVLTVSDSAGFCKAGGGIELTEVQNRLRYRVALEALAEAGLKPGDALLKSALTDLQ